MQIGEYVNFQAVYVGTWNFTKTNLIEIHNVNNVKTKIISNGKQ